MPLVGPDSQPQKPSMAASTTVPDSEVSSTVMAHNVLSFPARPDPGAAGPTMAGRFSRAIFQIGARRFVLEFRTWQLSTGAMTRSIWLSLVTDLVISSAIRTHVSPHCAPKSYFRNSSHTREGRQCLPVQPNHDDAISPCGAYVGKASAHAVESSEVGGVSGVEG